MLAYWLLFLFAVVAAFGASPTRSINPDGTWQARFDPAWLGVLLLLSVIIGFRLEVGGDWFTYLDYLDRAQWLGLADLTEIDDPGYIALNMLSLRLGWGMTGVNLMGAALFAGGLVAFLRTLPRPWLGLAVAIPYLVIVVAMGYTRQGIAIGLVMAGLAALRRERFFRFAVWVVVAALFHKSAVLAIPIAVLTSQRNRLQTIGLIGVICYAAYDALLAQHAGRLVDVYVNQQLTESQGALIRLTMNAVPAALFLRYGKQFLLTVREYRLWRVMSFLALAMFVALLSLGFTTALDRMALYLIPLQLVVFSHLPDALRRSIGNSKATTAMILLYHGLVLFVWLNFAAHSTYWLPYRMGLS